MHGRLTSDAGRDDLFTAASACPQTTISSLVATIVPTPKGRSNGGVRDTIATQDTQGHPCSHQEGGDMLGEDGVFLIRQAPHSYDSRYCGPVSRAAMPGKARQVWRWSMQDDSLPIMLCIVFVVGGGLGVFLALRALWDFMATGAAPWGTLIVILGGLLLGGGLAVWGFLSIVRRAWKR